MQTQGIIAKLKQMSKSKKLLFNEVSKLLKTLFVNPAASAVSECFSPKFTLVRHAMILPKNKTYFVLLKSN